MSFNIWRLIGVLFIMNAVYNLTTGNSPHEILYHLNWITLLLWIPLVVFEGVKK